MKKLIFTLFSALCLNASAAIKLPALFCDNMVLQQQSDVNIWGTADAGKTVTITASWDKKAKFSAKAGDDGKWKIAVKTPQAGGPYSVTISDGQSVTLNNVLVGEVWLCAGQSNMEMPMKGFKCQPVENGNRDAVLSTNPNMRLFTVKRSSSLTPKDDVVGSWLMANAESVREFSATAFYFGRMLQMVKPDVPVGLIVTAWGGSACEAWMDEKMLADFPSAQIPRTQEDIKSKNRTPTVLYNGMLHPVIGYGIRGAIWYQGEDNWNRAETYSDMMASMVSGWRAQWGIGDFPFYYCQIAPYDYSIITEKGQPIYNTAYLREQQVLALQKISNSGMACLMDAGLEKGIHPEKKQLAGERLAYQALSKTYGMKGVACESPTFKEMTIKNDTVDIVFNNCGMWPYIKGGESQNFEVAGEDGVFHPAKAWGVRSHILVKSDAVKKPVNVRYAFKNWAEGDVFCEGIPFTSFRTDNYKDPLTKKQ